MLEGTDDSQVANALGAVSGGGWLRCNNCNMVRGECVDCGVVLYAGRIFFNRSTHQYMKGSMLKALASHKKEGCSSAADASTSAAAAAAPGSQKRSRQATESGGDDDADDGWPSHDAADDGEAGWYAEEQEEDHHYQDQHDSCSDGAQEIGWDLYSVDLSDDPLPGVPTAELLMETTMMSPQCFSDLNQPQSKV